MLDQKETPKKRTPLIEKPKGPTQSPFQRFINSLTTIIIILFVVSSVYSVIFESKKSSEYIPLSKLAEDIKAGSVKSISIMGDTMEIAYDGDVVKESKKEVEQGLSETLVNYGVTTEQLSKVTIDIKSQTGFGYWFTQLAPFLIPIVFLGFLVWFMMRQARGAGVQAFSFGQSKARFIDPKDTNQRITFADVAGVKEAKEELKEVVDFLKNPKKFIEIGAQIPKGVLLMGGPGTGKTLLARAVAGEAGVPFFSISGSEFVEMFVGVGASRVRDLFQLAKKTSPSIIFVDEIDAVGRVRGTGVGGGNDEREQTLNQILVEMDGFEPSEKVIVIAATNRPDVLDPALLRPGRFDRRVVIDPPDKDDRKAILQIHARRKPLGPDVNLSVIAERTPGFSGADLYSLMNEGAILAARENRKEITQYDLIRSIEKVMIGPERRSHILGPDEKIITAYHEAGHAVVASVLPHADPVHKISIISRGHAAGYVLRLPIDEKKLKSKKVFVDNMAVSLGGYITEKLIFDDITTGPSSDLSYVSSVARDMVTKYGMSDKIGPIALETSDGRVLYGQVMGEKEYSEKVAGEIDSEVKYLVDESYARAYNAITENRALLEALKERLIEVETIEREEFDTLLRAHGITPKVKQEEVIALPDIEEGVIKKQHRSRSRKNKNSDLQLSP